jgi:hypothetical protein
MPGWMTWKYEETGLHKYTIKQIKYIYKILIHLAFWSTVVTYVYHLL